MPSKKSHRSQVAKSVVNRATRTFARNKVVKARKAVEVGDKKESYTALLEATSALDKAVVKGVIHKNKSARQKSRLARAYDNIE